MNAIKKILINNIGVKIISLICAIALWIIVVNIDDPDVTRSFSGIQVTVLDENIITDNNQVYSIKTGNVVSITVKGPRSMVDNMTIEDFYAQAPFSEMSSVNAVPIYVSFRNSKYERDCEISQKTRTMKLDVEDIIEKNFDISIVPSGKVSNSYSLTKETVSPEKVTVKAPESVVNRISSIGVKVDLDGRVESFTKNIELKCYSSNGAEISDLKDLTMSVTSAEYHADIYQVREVPVKIGSTGDVANGYELVDLTSDKTTLRISGPAAAQVESIQLPAELLNISGATSDMSVDADVAGLLPEGVYLYSDSDATIRITAKIEQLQTSTFTIPVSEIDKRNVPAGYSAEIEEKSVDVTIVGLQKSIDGFNVTDLEPYVDLANTVEGRNELIVHFKQLADGLNYLQEVRINVNMVNNTVAQQPETTTAAPAQ